MNQEKLDYIIERSFRTEPDFQLPDDFAQNVTVRVVQREQWKNDLYEYLYLTAIAVFLLGVATGTYYLVNKELLLQIISFISGNVILVVMVVFTLNFIFFADRVLLRLLFSRWKTNP